MLATKCGLIWHSQQGQHFFDEHNQPVHRYLGAESIRYELEQSLRRLKTDYIDLYQTHWQDATTPIAETMQTLLDFKKEGKIRAIGASNASLDDIQEYVRTGPLDTTQEKYSMLDREIETTLLPYCRENDIALLSYSSLALGLLTGKISPDRVFTGDDQRASDPRFSLENRQRVAAMLDRLTPIAERYTVTLPQLVIAWTMHQPGITFALCGARNGLQALENAQAGLIVLDEDDLQTIDTLLQTHTVQIT